MRIIWEMTAATLTLLGVVMCYPSTPHLTCSLCPPGTHVKHACTSQSDTICQPCEDGTFSDTETSLKACTPCSTCQHMAYIDKPCSNSSDTVCSPCSSAPDTKSEYYVLLCESPEMDSTGNDLDDLMMADEWNRQTKENIDNDVNPDNMHKDKNIGNVENDKEKQRKESSNGKAEESSKILALDYVNDEHTKTGDNEEIDDEGNTIPAKVEEAIDVHIKDTGNGRGEETSKTGTETETIYHSNNENDKNNGDLDEKNRSVKGYIANIDDDVHSTQNDDENSIEKVETDNKDAVGVSKSYGNHDFNERIDNGDDKHMPGYLSDDPAADSENGRKESDTFLMDTPMQNPQLDDGAITDAVGDKGNIPSRFSTAESDNKNKDQNTTTESDITDSKIHEFGVNPAHYVQDNSQPTTEPSDDAGVTQETFRLEEFHHINKETEINFTTSPLHENSSFNEGRFEGVKLSLDRDEDESAGMKDANVETATYPLSENDNSSLLLPENNSTIIADDDVIDHRVDLIRNSDIQSDVSHNKTSEDEVLAVGEQPTGQVDKQSGHAQDRLSESTLLGDGVAANNARAPGVPRAKEVKDEDRENDPEDKRRAAIILGVIIGGVVVFVLIFFATRLWKSRRGQFKEMKKVNNPVEDPVQLKPLTKPATNKNDETPAQFMNEPYLRAPNAGPLSKQIHQNAQVHPKMAAPDDSKTTPLLTVSSPIDELPDSFSDNEPLMSGVDALKYIDESTDDEYVKLVATRWSDYIPNNTDKGTPFTSVTQATVPP